MERFVKGDVVVIPFPFSDLSASKKRPAVVVANLPGHDYIVAQITSVSRTDECAISLEEKDFFSGKPPYSSKIRPNKLFTADRSLIAYKAGTLAKRKIKQIQNALIKIVSK